MGAVAIIGVPSSEIEGIANLLEWHFESFASNGETTPSRLLGEIVAQQRQCWIAWNDGVKACCLTQVSPPVVEITHCAGEGRADWAHRMVETIESWAAEIEATRVRIVCRPGWAKELKAMAYRETHRVMEREIGKK